jgi:Right handed beta helix region
VRSSVTGDQPPSIPGNELPSDASQVSFESMNLRWSCQDPDVTDSLKYDIYFGTSSTPPLVQSDATDTTYALGQLDPGSTYFWQIVAKDLYGGTTSSPVWTFETLSHATTVLSQATYDVDTTLSKADGPFIVEGYITVAANATLTIEPGTVLKMGANAQFIVNGTLIAQGTASDRIVITSEKDDAYLGDTNGDGFQTSPSAGDWNHINFAQTSQNNVLEYVDILYAGYGTSGQAIYVYNASPTVTNCTIRHSQGDGIYVQGGAAQITANAISDCGRYGINAYSGSSGTTIAGNSFAAIGGYDLYLSSGSGISVTGNSLTGGLEMEMNGVRSALDSFD